MNPVKPLLLWFKDRTARKAERKDRAPFADLEGQTASFAAADLARHGAAQRAATLAAKKAETTHALETGGTITLQRMPYAPLRGKAHG